MQKENLTLYEENANVKAEADKCKAELETLKSMLATSSKPDKAPASAVRDCYMLVKIVNEKLPIMQHLFELLLSKWSLLPLLLSRISPCYPLTLIQNKERVCADKTNVLIKTSVTPAGGSTPAKPQLTTAAERRAHSRALLEENPSASEEEVGECKQS